MKKQRIHELHEGCRNMVPHTLAIRWFVNLISFPFQIRWTGTDPLLIRTHLPLIFRSEQSLCCCWFGRKVCFLFISFCFQSVVFAKYSVCCPAESRQRQKKKKKVRKQKNKPFTQTNNSSNDWSDRKISGECVRINKFHDDTYAICMGLLMIDLWCDFVIGIGWKMVVMVALMVSLMSTRRLCLCGFVFVRTLILMCGSLEKINIYWKKW